MVPIATHHILLSSVAHGYVPPPALENRSGVEHRAVLGNCHDLALMCTYVRLFAYVYPVDQTRFVFVRAYERQLH